MIYEDLLFPNQKKPIFYTSFVATLDGKVQVKNDKKYWPIGSKTDYDVFTKLRSYADVIIDGKNTALTFGKNTIETIHSKKFLALRQKHKKEDFIDYIVITKHPNSALQNAFSNPFSFVPVVLPSIEKALLYIELKKYKMVFIDGGPALLGSFLEKNLLDEIFLTIAPKIFGTSSNTITLVQGQIFPPDKIKNLKLLSAKTIGDEVFLRYRVKKSS